MQTVTHPELVAALVKPPEAIMQSLSAFSTDLWHAATGIAGECGELLEALSMDPDAFNRENVVEELGDTEFYLQQLRSRIGEVRNEVAEEIASNLEISPDRLLHHAVSSAIYGLQILDTVKKCAIYNKELNYEALDGQLLSLDVALAAVRMSLGIVRDETLAHNVQKLSKRYAGLTYSDTAAQQRADKAESGETPQRKFFPGEPITGDTPDMVEKIRDQ